MDRRLFLTGMLGVAGATAVASVLRPAEALAGMPSARPGILDELDAPEADIPDAEATVEPVWHRGYPHRRWRRRRRRRRTWRRVCERYWRRGRWRRRCYRRRVWIWAYG